LRTTEDRALRRLFRPYREEVTVGRRKLHDEELLKLYSSSNIITVIKSRRMRWVGHMARIDETNAMQYFSQKTRREETTWEI
jgi:hypothetical protein